MDRATFYFRVQEILERLSFKHLQFLCLWFAEKMISAAWQHGIDLEPVNNYMAYARAYAEGSISQDDFVEACRRLRKAGKEINRSEIPFHHLHRRLACALFDGVCVTSMMFFDPRNSLTFILTQESLEVRGYCAKLDENWCQWYDELLSKEMASIVACLEAAVKNDEGFVPPVAPWQKRTVAIYKQQLEEALFE